MTALELILEHRESNGYKWRPTDHFNEAIELSKKHFGKVDRAYIVRGALRSFRDSKFKYVPTVKKGANTPVTLEINDSIALTEKRYGKMTKYDIEGIVIA